MKNKRYLISSIILSISIISLILLILLLPWKSDPFTEFYILGPDGKADKYPVNLYVNEIGNVTIGIINRESEVITYRIDVYTNNVLQNTYIFENVLNGDKIEKILEFSMDSPGERQLVEFILFKGKTNNPYLQPLKIYVNVSIAEDTANQTEANN